ncbi:protocadherin gamma-B5-like [Bombina bombina]|uniref:protocadherin gamma-B5-like n=1 Tax=Bombina bombina TaxID=8345 RepID=UPI00235ACD14|nr:protocadherin gamma-B5-like [Bombina bombina]
MALQVILFYCFFLCEAASDHLQYSIYEEMKKGSIVGNVANDLGIDNTELLYRKLQISSQTEKQYFNINFENGNIFVIDRIDREVICRTEQKCFLNLEILVENPVNIFHVRVEIQDINDNAPSFSKDLFDIEIGEFSSPGTHFILGNAQDPDLGINSVQSYKLSFNQHFTLGEKTRANGIKYPELVLEKPLDREEQSIYNLILTAYDGGTPVKSGTAQIRVIVHDVNDNFPAFSQEKYQVTLNENIPNGFLVLQLNATDADEGTNAEITYSFSHIAKNAMETFTLDSQSGVIRTKGELDFEVTKMYEMMVEAKDGGGLVGHCTVSIQIIDINDNAPKIITKSLTTPIPEDSLPGTLVAIINVHDLDSGKNGEVICQLFGELPFKLLSSSVGYYKLVTTQPMDRETTSNYNIIVKAEDGGSPPLFSNKTIQLAISDINDNPPVFDKTNYVAYVMENNLAGTSIHRVHASDFDNNENARIIFSILNIDIENIPISSYISINSATGIIYAQRSFDYEQLREIQFRVMAKDSGSPPLSSNATVRICIVDRNDNAPKFLYPSTDTDEPALVEFIPHTSEKGYLITKVIAVDADSGHNAWLSYHFLQIPEPASFIIGQNTGEIKLAQSLHDTDSLRQKVIVMVKDNGEPPLSATVTVKFVMGETYQQVLPEISSQPGNLETQSNITLFLVISIAVISLLFILTVIATVISKYRKASTSTPFGTLTRDMFPQVGLTYPTQFSDGTLPLPYSYNVCVALESSQNEFAHLKPIQNVPIDNLIDTDDSVPGNDSLIKNVPSEDQTCLSSSFWLTSSIPRNSDPGISEVSIETGPTPLDVLSDPAVTSGRATGVTGGVQVTKATCLAPVYALFVWTNQAERVLTVTEKQFLLLISGYWLSLCCLQTAKKGAVEMEGPTQPLT